jgi:hypothetical protein
MVSPVDLLESIQKSTAGINIAELLARHPQVPRRTAQRWIQQLLREGKVRGTGNGRARRYLAVQPPATKAKCRSDSPVRGSPEYACSLFRWSHNRLRCTRQARTSRKGCVCGVPVISAGTIPNEHGKGARRLARLYDDRRSTGRKGDEHRALASSFAIKAIEIAYGPDNGKERNANPQTSRTGLVEASAPCPVLINHCREFVGSQTGFPPVCVAEKLRATEDSRTNRHR